MDGVKLEIWWDGWRGSVRKKIGVAKVITTKRLGISLVA